MKSAALNRQIVSFCAISLLFLGSLFYFVSVAFKSKNTMQAREDVTQDLINNL